MMNKYGRIKCNYDDFVLYLHANGAKVIINLSFTYLLVKSACFSRYFCGAGFMVGGLRSNLGICFVEGINLDYTSS